MSRTTAVPAQITTVEDKIIGSLSMMQLILLGSALIGSGLLFLFFAPASRISILKIVLLVVLNLLCCGSAFRYKDELLVKWAVLGLRYTSRPRRWVYDKNSVYARPLRQIETKTAAEKLVAKEVTYEPIDALDTPARVRLEHLMRDPAAQVRFVNTKGGMKVVYTKTE